MSDLTPDADANAERATVLSVAFAGGVTGATEDAVADAAFAVSPETVGFPEQVGDVQPLPEAEMSATIPVPVTNDPRMGVVVLLYKGWLRFGNGFEEEMRHRSLDYIDHSVTHVPEVSGPPSN